MGLSQNTEFASRLTPLYKSNPTFYLSYLYIPEQSAAATEPRKEPRTSLMSQLPASNTTECERTLDDIIKEVDRSVQCPEAESLLLT